MGGLFCLAYPRHIAPVCLIVLGSAVLFEYLQTLTPDRHGQVLGALEKLAGGVLGIWTARIVSHFWLQSRDS
jgi:VanZ family protein